MELLARDAAILFVDLVTNGASAARALSCHVERSRDISGSGGFQAAGAIWKSPFLALFV